MMANITFLSFLLFSMCHSIHVAVNTWLNCSFFTLIIIINDIYRAQTLQVQQMRKVSCCMVTVILEQEHFQSFPEH